MKRPGSDDRLHDLEALYAGFKGALALIRSGYRFEGEEGQQALGQLERLLGALRAEIERIQKI